MGLLDWLKWLLGSDQISAIKQINEEYRFKIQEQNEIIKELKQNRGKPVDAESQEVQYEREKYAHEQLIECIREKRDLKEEILFLNIEIRKLQEKLKT